RTRVPDLWKVVLYPLSYSRKFVGVVFRISASLRDAHYTRNQFSCKPLNALYRDFCLNADEITKQ
ncbi:hypothetical protein ACQWHW_24855, partial [Salmonella enterica subsp. enterica serovar Infantis]